MIDQFEEVFTGRFGNPDARALGIESAGLNGVADTGEMIVTYRPGLRPWSGSVSPSGVRSPKVTRWLAVTETKVSFPVLFQ